MAWRVARSLDMLLWQINAAFPSRSKLSDGSIGDLAHSSRTSDHNPDPSGVVRARDFTHDPGAGFDAHAFADRLRLARDPRIKYVISDRRIFSGNAGPSPWVWRRYTGLNPHTKHVHVSVVSGAIADTTNAWAGVTGSTVAASRIPDIPANLDDLTPEEEMALEAKIDELIKVTAESNRIQQTFYDHMRGKFYADLLGALESSTNKAGALHAAGQRDLEISLLDKIAKHLGAVE